MNGWSISRPGHSARHCFAALFIGAWVPAAFTSSAAPVGAIRTIALSGQQAPDAPPGARFGMFFGSPQMLNDAGRTAFEARLMGDGINDANRIGIWSDTTGGLRLVADPRLFGSNVAGAFFDQWALNNAGQIALSASRRSSDLVELIDAGIWVQSASGLELVARHGGPAPDTPAGLNFDFQESPSFFSSLNNAGQIVLRAFLSGDGVDSTNSQGIWMGSAGALRLVARTGNQASGAPSGVNFDEFHFRPELDDAGQTAFIASLTGPGVDSTNDAGIWAERSGNPELVAREGSPVPAIGSGAVYDTIGLPTLNNAGQIAFTANVTGGRIIPSLNGRGIWSGDPRNLSLRVQSGTRASGTPAAVNFRDFGEFRPLLNNAGRIAFLGSLTGPGVDDSNFQGIWAEGPGGLTLIVRRGDHAPGTPDGIHFGIANPNFPAFTDIRFNDAGQVAFTGISDGPDVVFAFNDQGIWATDRSGALQLIVRQRDELEVAPGDVRIITNFALVGFNNVGQIEFHAQFTDGSEGLFISNLVAIPEPSSMLLLALEVITVFPYALAGCIRRKRGRNVRERDSNSAESTCNSSAQSGFQRNSPFVLM